MSRLKQLQLEIAHLIDHTADQATIVDLFISVKTGGASAILREKTAKTIIDLRSIYGKKLDEAVTILMDADNRMSEHNLTNCKTVPQTQEPNQELNHESECGR
jgi:hypothetical protein